MIENKTIIPTEMEKLDKKIGDIEKKIREYKEKRDEKVRRKNQKQKEWWDNDCGGHVGDDGRAN